MLSKMSGWIIKSVVIAAGATIVAAPAMSVTQFETDVGTAITKGLGWLAAQNAYTGGGNYREAGLANLALLEKRASGNPGDPPQGYTGANAADQATLLAGANYLVQTVKNGGSPDSYRDGNYLAALVEYLQTGGPDPASGSVLTAINSLADSLIANQRVAANGVADLGPPYPPGTDQGYWCYNGPYCRDSSTTQYAALGLAAAQAVYGPGGKSPDPVRFGKITTALTTAANMYVLNAAPNPAAYGYHPAGSDDPNCGVVDAKERGHGYHSPILENYNPSLQQTASGLFVQALGGSDINSPGVQAYLDWLYNHYRYTDLGSMGNSWPSNSYSYYLWSSFKATEFLTAKGTAVAPGNLAPNVLGTQAPDAGPPTGKCSSRQLQRNPANDVQIPSFGSGGAGTYSATAKGQYYDYAYQILSSQAADGSFSVGISPWDATANQSYMLLVLQRAAGVIIPTVTLTASPTSVIIGTNATLTWKSVNANTCTASTGNGTDGWSGALAVNGSQAVHETTVGPHLYTISCTTGTQTVTATATVTYTPVATCDLDKNGVIDSRDLAILKTYIGLKVPPAPSAADANGDGLITVQDARLCTAKCTLANCAIPPGT